MNKYTGHKILIGLFLLASITDAIADTLSSMVSPVTNPVNFEDPRIQSEIRPIYLYHKIDDKFVTSGGAAQIVALQLRYALTDRLAIIATKDGYVNFRPDAVLNDGNGIANVEGGIKYALHQSDSEIVSALLRYEAPVGDEDILHGKGDGFIHPSLSAGLACDSFNAVAATGVRLPIDNADSTFFDLDAHIDYPIGDFYPALELNLVHVLKAGNRLPIADEGQDFFSFGSSQSDGETMLTGAIAARYRVSKDLDFGMAYQIPLEDSSGSYITDWRFTTDLVVRF